MDLNKLLIDFSPELILTLGALVVMGYDLLVRGRDAAQAWIAGATLVLALVATFGLYAREPTALFLTGQGATATGAFLSDGFTNFFRMAGLLTTLLVLLSGVTFMRPRTPYKGEFYMLLLSAALAMNLMAGANDLILIAIAIEFLSIASYVLTGFLRGDKLSGEGGVKYFLYGAIASATMFYGLVLLYGATGTTSLTTLAQVVSSHESLFVGDIARLAVPALTLVLVGFGFKIAVVPFHQWSPDAYQGAPTPVTSFLSIGPKAAGFAVTLRFLVSAFSLPAFSASWIMILTIIAILTMAFGNIVALVQSNVKRMMAYSSIAQAGYMLIGLASFGAATVVLRQQALGSVLVYVLAYVFTNAGLFAAIIAVDHATGSTELSAFAGLMRRSPLLAVSMFVFFLSLVGIPPLAGFIGKFSVFTAALNAGQGALAVIGVLVGVVSVGYYFAVARQMFFQPAPDDAPPFRASQSLTFVVVACLAMTLAIGLYPDPFVKLANDAVQAIMPAAALAAQAAP